MDKLSIRTPTTADLIRALGAARSAHVALPAVLSFATLALLTNVLTAAISVSITTYLHLLFAQLEQPEPAPSPPAPPPSARE